MAKMCQKGRFGLLLWLPLSNYFDSRYKSLTGVLIILRAIETCIREAVVWKWPDIDLGWLTQKWLSQKRVNFGYSWPPISASIIIDNLILLSNDIHRLISTSNEGGGPDQFGCTKTRFLRPYFFSSKLDHFWPLPAPTPPRPQTDTKTSELETPYLHEV
jgi:hypothetical protein